MGKQTETREEFLARHPAAVVAECIALGFEVVACTEQDCDYPTCTGWRWRMRPEIMEHYLATPRRKDH